MLRIERDRVSFDPCSEHDCFMLFARKIFSSRIVDLYGGNERLFPGRRADDGGTEYAM